MNKFLVLLLLCGSLSCTTASDDPADSSNLLVGAWQGEPRETQLGSSVETFCFRKDGTVNVKNVTQAGLIENYGMYSLDGTQLNLTWTTGSSATVETQLRSNVLLLKSIGGWQRYKRIESGC